MKIGYLGPAGSFSEIAAKALFSSSTHNFVIYNSLDDLQAALLKGEADTVVMPIFNSKEGQLASLSSKRTYIGQFLEAARSQPLHIVAEKFIELNFCLLAKPGTNIVDIRHVHVNPYGENLCRNFLSQHPGWKIQKHTSSSAAAAALLQDPDNTYAALSARQAADQYGLVVLEENILSGADVPVMHFLAVSRFPHERLSVPTKETVSVYALPSADIKGTLASLQQRGIRPSNVYPVDENLFYFEIEGHFNPAEIPGCMHFGTYPACQQRRSCQPSMQTELLSFLSHSPRARL